MKKEHKLTQEFHSRIHGERLMRELLRPRQPKSEDDKGPFCDTEKALRLIDTADLTVRSNEVRETPKAWAEKRGLTAAFMRGDGDPGDTPLTAALRNKHSKIREKLQPLVDPNECNNMGEHPVIVALGARREKDAVALILDPRTKLDGLTDSLGHNLPTLASAAGMHDAIDALHARGVNLHAVSNVHTNGVPTGKSHALHWAVYNADSSMVLKLAQGAPKDMIDDTLHQAGDILRNSRRGEKRHTAAAQICHILKEAQKAARIPQVAVSATRQYS